MKTVVSLFFLLVFLQAGASEDIYESARKLGHLDTDGLVGWATRHYQDETDIGKFFYYWIALHVEYQNNGFSDRSSHNAQNPGLAGQVMKTRRAVCAGFAGLYCHLLSQSGIACVVVNGMSKTRDNILTDIPYSEDHSWNALKTDGQWHLVDVTWANTTARDGVVDDFYFMTDPEIFILDHFPTDPSWQLLTVPVTEGEFRSFPCYSKKYFQLGFGGYSGGTVSRQRDGRYSVRIGVSEEWLAVPVAVSANDRGEDALDHSVSTGAFGIYQTLTFQTRKKVLRIDAVRQEKNYILTELGIAYFVVDN